MPTRQIVMWLVVDLFMALINVLIAIQTNNSHWNIIPALFMLFLAITCMRALFLKWKGGDL